MTGPLRHLPPEQAGGIVDGRLPARRRGHRSMVNTRGRPSVCEWAYAPKTWTRWRRNQRERLWGQV